MKERKTELQNKNFNKKEYNESEFFSAFSICKYFVSYIKIKSIVQWRTLDSKSEALNFFVFPICSLFFLVTDITFLDAGCLKKFKKMRMRIRGNVFRGKR